MCVKYFTDILSEIWTWCHYDEPAIESIENGILYNWYVIKDTRYICSEGWHIPTQDEINNLAIFLDAGFNPGAPDFDITSVDAGHKLRETGTTYWVAPNTGATNLTGFNGRGSGRRYGSDGSFNGLLNNANFWLIAGDEPDSNRCFALDESFLQTFGYSSTGVNDGYSIRPFKDSTALSDKESGTYTDPSGYTYRTICIGTQEVVADNIKTVHYRNGDPIPEVADSGTWTGLASGAWCYYNNDPSYV